MTNTILVTGGTGFLGQRLALKLRDLGHRVTILGRNLAIGNALRQQGLQFIQADLQDPIAVVDACRSQDLVFHCGGLSSPWGRYQDFYSANVLGTQNVIMGCQTHNVQRLIHVSTSSVYFDFCDRLNLPESTPFPQPANYYAKTKQLAEQAIQSAHSQGLAVITIRPRAIVGPGDPTILPRIIRANQRFGILLMRSGQIWVDMTYIDNVVDALLCCQTAPDALLGRVFNITNGEPMYLVNLLETVFERLDYPFRPRPIAYPLAHTGASLLELASNLFLAGREPALTRYTVGLFAFSQTLDITAARQELGYIPQITIDAGINQFVAWWKQKHGEEN